MRGMRGEAITLLENDHHEVVRSSAQTKAADADLVTRRWFRLLGRRRHFEIEEKAFNPTIRERAHATSNSALKKPCAVPLAQSEPQELGEGSIIKAPAAAYESKSDES
jgi:hypothetical protein